MNLVTATLSAFAKASPQQTALILLDEQGGVERLSYWLLEQQVLAVAAGLRQLPMAEGSVLFIQHGNSLDSILLFFATIAAGHIAVPLSSQLSGYEIARLAERLRPAYIFSAKADELATPAGPSVRELRSASALHEPVRQRLRDTAYILFTSGSSGEPRAVAHGHKVIQGREPIRKQWLQLSADDVLLHAGDFNWSYTLGCGLLDTWAEGAAGALYTGERKPERWPELINRAGATIFAAVPALYRRVLKYADLASLKGSRLRFAVSAGDALPAAVYSEWRERTGLELYEAFGMTECSTFISSGARVNVRPGSPGKIQAGRHIDVIDEASGQPVAPGVIGQLAVHHDEPGLMLGYLEGEKQADLSPGDHWFLTGDLMLRDELGYLWPQGRVDDMLNVSGFRISPLEVERALLSHPEVLEAAVTATQAKLHVDVITAFIVRKQLGKRPDIEVLVKHLQARLAEYKQPRRYVFVTRLPRNANGKVLRRELAQRFSRLKPEQDNDNE